MKWEMQGHHFTQNVYVLDLEPYDLILGMDWMKHYSPMTFDLKELTLSFDKEGEIVLLQGDSHTAKVRMTQGTAEQSSNLDSHLKHLSLVLNTLRTHSLHAKMSKCSFGQDKIDYLGHVVTAKDVSANPAKVEAMLSWPVPDNIKALRGFLGLTGYYRRFVKGYGKIAKPLTELLKKDSFVWNEAATSAFEQLKVAMTQAPVLALPNFSMPFILETDASQTAMGAVLMQ
ncbi:uncharacterized protein LOC113766598 [Coffea eugenioides]|uniref:uncharacterized protein LOC113766598 n=1 Tax=Coffea eugenioides TaxID=49369 RepID=UPI000F5C3C56|nr:uncharacterized protein LOC113737720 [Coffea arabica]XP_027166575.1 uncharacterized protein LOC113766598 [Coffea eugenioides]